MRSASTGPGRDVWLAGEPVASTRTESDVLAALSEPPRIVFTQRQLINHVWGPEWLGDGACSTFASGVYYKDPTGFAKALKPIYPPRTVAVPGCALPGVGRRATRVRHLP